MPIEVRELHIRVVVQDTSEAALGSSGGAFAVEGDTSQYPDHKNWIDVTAVNMGGHKPGGGAAGDDAPTEEVSFAYAQVEVQRTEGGGRDILIGGAGADHIDATDNRGHLLSFTKVMLRTDQDPGSDIGDSLVLEDSRWGELDPQGRLLLGSEQDIWRDGDFDGHGKADLGTYQPDTIDTDLPLSTADAGGIPVSMAEHAFLLF
jgi:hypothetical protein